MSTSIYVFTIGVIFGTILLIAGARHLAVTRQAQARMAEAEVYRMRIDQALGAC
jgi:hypothetical protein